MGLALLVGGLGLLVLPGLTSRLGRVVAPAEWARLCALALSTGAVVVELAAALYAAPTVLRAAGLDSLASACERMLGPIAPGGAIAGWGMATVALALPTLVGRGVARARRTYRGIHVEPWLAEHQRFGDHDLVVLPTDELVAVSVDGGRPQIIVSSGLVAALSPAELEGVLRHEASHLHHHHQRLLLLATALESARVLLPLVRRSTAALRTAVERWADEDAAGATGKWRQALRDALLGMTDAAVDSAVAAFSPAETVLERVRALEAPSPPATGLRRALLYLPGLVLAAVVLVAMASWTCEAGVLAAIAGRCPA